MLNRLMGAILMVALASSPIACGTASSKPFDPRDLSGFWDITNIGLPAGALNATSNNRPQMTPSGFGKVSQDEDGRCHSIEQWKFPERKRLE